LDEFTTWYSISKLNCKVICTSCSPSLLYCSTQVSASVLFSQMHSCTNYIATAAPCVGSTEHAFYMQHFKNLLYSHLHLIHFHYTDRQPSFHSFH
jgi:hypothetical protein